MVLLAAALVGVSVGAALGYGPLLRYKSDGLLNLEMGTAEYKRFAELAVDAETVRQFAAVSPPVGTDPQWVNQLVRDVAKGDWLKPIHKLSKVDAKDFPDALIQTDKDKTQLPYLGVRVSQGAAKPEDAARGASWLGAYFKDIATRETLRNLVDGWTAENRQFGDRAIERKLKLEFDIEQAETRSTALQKLVASYPDSARPETRQVIDVRKDNEKFMSPLAQLVGSESEVIDIKQHIIKIEREIEQQLFAKAIVLEAQAVLGQARSGSEVVVGLSDIVVRFRKKVKTEAEREKLSSIAADISQTSARFLSRAQFIAQPSVPTMPERPRPLMVMVLAALLACFLSALYLWRHKLKEMLSQVDENKVY